MSQASFAKRQREKERREKAEAKAVRRAERQANASANADERPPPQPQADQEALLAELAALHARFDEGDMDFEDFAAAKQQITERLQVG